MVTASLLWTKPTYWGLSMMTSFALKDIKFVLDSDYPDKIEIHLLDKDGAIEEGGQFDLESFIACVLEFYNANY